VNLWMGIKRLNTRYDDWSKRVVGRMIESLDHPAKRSVQKHISVWDLLAKGPDPKEK
jgi:hypothetical protein